MSTKPPPWADSLFNNRCSTQSTPLASVHSAGFKLPAFQRGERWTPEMQASFCSAVLKGDPVPPILLWDRRDGTWVIDGQQRLTALGAPIMRADGSYNTHTAAYFDVKTGSFSLRQGRWSLTAAQLARWHSLGKPKTARVAREWDWTAIAGTVLRKRNLVTYVLGPDATQEDAVRVFKSINTPGIPMSPGEVEALIASAYSRSA
jgi:hypothetical protein